MYFEKYNKYKNKYLKFKIGQTLEDDNNNYAKKYMKWKYIPMMITVTDTIVIIKFSMKNNKLTHVFILNYKNGDRYLFIELNKEISKNEVNEFIKANVQSDVNNFAFLEGSIIVKFPGKDENNLTDLWEYLNNFASFLGVDPESGTTISFAKTDSDPLIKAMMKELPQRFEELNRELL